MLNFRGTSLLSWKTLKLWTVYNFIVLNYKFSSRSPYDVLGLKSTCTTKDVKKAYIKLCKELHPDTKPGDASQQQKFVELNKAYTTLVNPKSRKQYDTNLQDYVPNRRRGFQSQSQQQNASGSYYQGSWNQGSSWYEKEHFNEYYPKPNRRSKDSFKQRLNNVWIVAGCFLLVTVGSGLYLMAYRYATSYTLTKVDKKSKKISEEYDDTRKYILVEGREKQLEKLKKKWNL